MLKKFLPFLQKLKELKLPKLPKLPKPFGFFKKHSTTEVTSLIPEAPEQYSDLNLIVKTGGNPLANIKYDRILVLLEVLIVGSMLLFIVLVSVNQTLTARLDEVKRDTDRLYSDISEYDDAIEKTRNLSRRIQFYKDKLASRLSLADKTRLISSISNDQTDIVKVSVSESTFYLSAKGNSALMFANILETYKKSNRVGEIRLTSARLVKDKVTKQNGFAVELEGVFK